MRSARANGAFASSISSTGYPFLAARVERLPEVETTTKHVEARMLNLRNQTMEVLQLLPQTPAELVNAVQGVASAAQLADLIASFMDIAPSEKQEILETVDLERRLDRVSALLDYRLEVLRLSRQISEQTKGKLDDRQREFLLREQLKTIQKELGEGDDAKSQEIAELSKKIDDAKMPPEIEAHARRELARLERMPEMAGEYSMARTYLEWLIELPWSVESGGAIDIAEARRILDADHYGLAKVKRRILEYLAIHKLNPGGRSPILCFVGPPGVGKTSLGQSIARATGRKFVRVSLGGVHDEAEIRGHRRTYIGALPGNIIQGIRRAGSRDCVMMLDEVDKLGRGIQGDPSSALLEVLDPEQNGTFQRQLPGGAVRPVAGHVHHHGEHARHRPRPVARPHGNHRPARLCRGRKARNRPPLPGRPSAQSQRADRRAGRNRRARRCARSSATIPAKPACASSSARSARYCATSPCASPRGPRGRFGSGRTT